MLRWPPKAALEARASGALHVAVDHALLARLVEGHRELVAVDRNDVAVAEFQVKHAVADRIGRYRAGRFGDELTLDRQRPAPVRPAAACSRSPCIGLRGLLLGAHAVARAAPAGSFVIGRER